MKALGVKGMTQINPDDPIQELNLKGALEVIEFEKQNLVQKCYDFIGTNIVECVHLPAFGVTMWLDEEGLLKNDVLPNLDGTLLFMRQHQVTQAIMGHVVFTSDKTDEEGWALGLEDDELEKLTKEILYMQSRRPDKAFATDVMNDEPTKG